MGHGTFSSVDRRFRCKKGPFKGSEEYRETVDQSSALKFMNMWKNWRWYYKTFKDNRAMWRGNELEKEKNIFLFTILDDASIAP